MRVYSESWAISKLVRERDKIDPRPQYQRSPVWNLARKQLLIDTVLRNYDMPKVYLRKVDTPTYEFEVTDGQQRLHAMWEFSQDKFSLGEASSDLPSGNLEGKLCSELPMEVREQFFEFQLHVSELHDANDQEIRDLFLRLQEGVSLNPAEKRNATLGGMRDFIAALASEPHPVFPLTRLANRRFDWDNLAAHIACLDMADGPHDLSAAALSKFYADYDGFDAEGSDAKRIRRRLNYMARVLHDEPEYMDIKWGFVDLYQIILRLDDEYVLRGREADLAQVFITMETDRRQVDDPADLIKPGRDQWDRDLYDYIMAFQREGAKRANLEVRRRVYRNRVFRDIPDLAPKDRTRGFSRDQRIVLWMRAGQKCEVCSKELSFEEMHADHIVPHVEGGATTLENGQCLCSTHNLQKGAR